MTKSHDSTTSRRLNKLPSNILKTAEPGSYGDGGNLWLIISPTGGKQWEFRYSVRGRVRHKGLGSARHVSLAQAREKAADCRALLAKGVDPLDAEKASRNASLARKTFLWCASELIASKEPGWRSDKHVRQWGATILAYCQALLNRPVDEIDTAAVLSILKPIWGRFQKLHLAFADASKLSLTMQKRTAGVPVRTRRPGAGISPSFYQNARSSRAATSQPCLSMTFRNLSAACASGNPWRRWLSNS